MIGFARQEIERLYVFLLLIRKIQRSGGESLCQRIADSVQNIQIFLQALIAGCRFFCVR